MPKKAFHRASNAPKSAQKPQKEFSDREKAQAIAFSPPSTDEIKLVPKHLHATYRQILTSCSRKPLSDRGASLLQMLSFSPNNPFTLFRLAFFYGVTGQNDKARDSLDRAIPLLKHSGISPEKAQIILTSGLEFRI